MNITMLKKGFSFAHLVGLGKKGKAEDEKDEKEDTGERDHEDANAKHARGQRHPKRTKTANRPKTNPTMMMPPAWKKWTMMKRTMTATKMLTATRKEKG